MKKILYTILIITFPLLTFAQTDSQREWDEYCKRTIHTRFDGWSLGDRTKEIKVKIPKAGLKCDYSFSSAYGLPGQSNVHSLIDLSADPLLMDSLSTKTLSYQRYVRGEVNRDEMCRELKELNKLAEANNGLLIGKGIIERVRQERTSSKNTDVFYSEKLTLQFSNGSFWHGLRVLNLKGKYCLKRPK